MNRGHILPVLAAALALAACSKNDNAAPTAAASGAPATTAAAKTAGPTTTAAATAAAADAKGPVGLKTGEKFAASCDTMEKDSECGEVVVTSDAEKDKSSAALKQLCGKGTYSADKLCPSDKMVGTCRIMKDIIDHYYSTGPKAYTAETAKKECEKNMGHWVE